MRIRSLIEDLLLTVAANGGQKTSRRNAWAAMSEDAARARARRDAHVALAAADRRARRAVGTGT